MAESPTIRVVLVDDHAVIRAGLLQLLLVSGDIEVVGEAADGEEALAVVRSTRPDLVVMDLQMPGTDGVKATRRIVAEGLSEVLVLTSFSDNERILGALEAGAVGYLLKDADPDVLLAGIRAVRRGESPLDPKAARTLLGARATSTRSGLTNREVEILRLVRDGLTNRVIATRLGITERTVKAHLTSAFTRIAVVDRTQAALWVERNNP